MRQTFPLPQYSRQKVANMNSWFKKAEWTIWAIVSLTTITGEHRADHLDAVIACARLWLTFGPCLITLQNLCHYFLTVLYWLLTYWLNNFESSYESIHHWDSALLCLLHFPPISQRLNAWKWCNLVVRERKKNTECCFISSTFNLRPFKEPNLCLYWRTAQRIS